MNPCVKSFLDFCPQDRLLMIILIIVLIGAGYTIGTDGHWNRFYWKNKHDVSHAVSETDGKE